MMDEVPRSYVENYVRMINVLAGDMRAKLSAELAEVDLSDVSRAREQTIAIMQRYCGPYTDYASVIAAQFFDGLSERVTGSAASAIAESGRVPEATAGAVRAIMKDVVDGKPREVWEGKLLGRADKEIRNAADVCIARNANRAHVRWARVPQGMVTCEFCIMLASRGAVYKTEETASSGHENCDCRVLPDFGKGIEGYDPDLYKDMWEHPEEYPELQEARRERRRELYAESHKSERKAKRRQASLEETERRRIAALSDEAKTVAGSRGFADQFGQSATSRVEAAIDGAAKSGDRARVNAARLLSRDIAEGFEVGSMSAEKNSYSTSTGAVSFTEEGAKSARTIAHELAHRRDHRRSPGYTARELGRDGMIDAAAATSPDSWFSMSFKHGEETLASRFSINEPAGETPAWRALKRRLGVKTDAEAKAELDRRRIQAGLSKDDAASLSDIIHAASNGKIRFKHGHFPKDDGTEYWDNTTRVLETWADYNASLVANAKEAWLIRDLFPEETDIMNAMLEVMI